MFYLKKTILKLCYFILSPILNLINYKNAFEKRREKVNIFEQLEFSMIGNIVLYVEEY